MCQWKLDRCEVEPLDSAAACSFLPESDDEDNLVDMDQPNNDGPRMLDDSDDEDNDNDNDNGNDTEEDDGVEEPKTPEAARPPPPAKTPPPAPKKIRKKKVVKPGN